LFSYQVFIWGYKLIQRERFIENANKYISSVSAFEGNYLLKSKIIANENKIILTYGGKNLTDEQKNSIIQKASNFNLKKPEVIIEQGLIFEEIDNKYKEVVQLRNELSQLSNIVKEKQIQLDSISKIPYTGKPLLDELKKFYPQIKSCIYAETMQFNDTTDTPEKIRVIIFLTDKNKILESDKKKIKEWVKTRLNSNNVKVIYE